MKILVQGNTRPDNSYGIVNVYLANALRARGHQVLVEPWDQAPTTFDRAWERSGIEPFSGELEGNCDLVIRQYWPPVWERPSCRQFVVIQPYEYGAVPLSWVAGTANVDAIWVPSTFAKSCWVKAGADDKRIFVVPNGIRPHGVVAKPVPGRLLYVGGGIWRKGIDILFSALGGLSKSEISSIELVIKETGYDSYYTGQSLVDQLLESNPAVAARTTILRDEMSHRELLELMAAAAALIHPYRAEGFGLPMLEALSVGVPVIATQGGAADDFLDDDNAYLVHSKFMFGMAAIDEQLGPAGGLQHWVDAEVESLQGRIREVIHFPASPERTAAGLETASRYTWERAAIAADRAIELMTGHGQPDDIISAVIGRVESPAGASIPALASELVSIGDIHGALFLLEQRAAGKVPDRLADELRRMVAERGDIWASADYRLHMANRERSPLFSSVHSFEGNLAATTRTATFLGKFFLAATSVIDLGCGDGAMLRYLKQEGITAVGIDIDPDRVRALRSEGIAVEVGLLPEALSAHGDNAYDGAFLGHIVEHLNRHDLYLLCTELRRTLRPGSVVVIQTPDFSLPEVGLKNFWLDPTHIRPYPAELLGNILNEFGFEVLPGASGNLTPIAPLDVYVSARRRFDFAAEERPASCSVVYSGILSGKSGFAHATADLLKVLEGDLGLAVDKANCTNGPFMVTSVPPMVVATVFDIPLPWLELSPPLPSSGHRILRTTFEAFGIPKRLVRTMNGFDQIWCMSSYDQKIFEDAGVDPSRILRVPPRLLHAADAKQVREYRLAREPRERLLSVFKFEERKNPRALLSAFAQVASARPEARLTLKVEGISTADFYRFALSIPGVGSEAISRIKVVDRILSEEEMARLYLEADAFVLPSRGEGFGLPFLEALSFGVPVIAPELGGYRDFCDEENSYLVPERLIGAGGEQLTPIYRGTRWVEVDSSELAATVISALDSKDELVKRGVNGIVAAARHNATDVPALVAAALRD